MELFWILVTLCAVAMIAMMFFMFRHGCASGTGRARCCGAEPKVDAPKASS